MAPRSARTSLFAAATSLARHDSSRMATKRCFTSIFARPSHGPERQIKLQARPVIKPLPRGIDIALISSPSLRSSDTPSHMLSPYSLFGPAAILNSTLPPDALASFPNRSISPFISPRKLVTFCIRPPTLPTAAAISSNSSWFAWVPGMCLPSGNLWNNSLEVEKPRAPAFTASLANVAIFVLSSGVACSSTALSPIT